MAKVNWTDAQKKFINAKRGPVLVSAAAGSGKTASIVERVSKRLSDKEMSPLSTNRLLMTTFSNAAANEMLSRIEAKLTEKLLENPEDKELQDQLDDIFNAQISTIHSFCIKVVRENFSKLGLFCDFHIINEAENEILKGKIANRVVENAYVENSPEFLGLVELICDSRSDSNLASIILKLYQKVIAMPFPFDVIDGWLELSKPTSESYEKNMAVLISAVSRNIGFARELCKKHLNEWEHPKRSIIQEDLDNLDKLSAFLSSGETEKAYEMAKSLRFYNNSFPRKVDDPELVNKIKRQRNAAKFALEKAADLIAYSSYESFCDDQNFLFPSLNKLFELLKEFLKEYAAAKREKNAIDFNDAEQFMLELLWQKNENGEYVQTSLANELKDRFDEIYIDEYQDVNLAQEKIFEAISHKNGNVFMVGDVKQSIYRFRQADSELFELKKIAFSKFDGENFPAKIFFGSNFRSRKGVTDFINEIFLKIMTKSVCGMDYTQDDALKAEGTFPEKNGENVSLLIYNSINGESSLERKEQEALIVAKHIKKLVESKFQVSEGKDKLRDCQYKDFCILLRSDSGKFSIFSKALNSLGIKSVTECDGDDLLNSREILIVLSILKALNNPFNDVALCGAMMSSVFLFTPKELALIRAGKRKRNQSLFSSVNLRAEEGDEKCRDFLEKFRMLQNIAAGQNVDSLLLALYNEFCIYNMAGAMNDGETRMNNLDALRMYARQFEENGYKGLGDFLRFIDSIAENDNTKLKSVKSIENSNAVKIMTIHKSKGLEFPICIIAHTVGQFNTVDLNSSIQINKKRGIAVKVSKEKLGISYSPFSFKATRILEEDDLIAEEMRTLYVALTRAKEKLIIPIVDKNLEDRFEAICARMSENSDYALRERKNYLDWIMLSVFDLPCLEELTDRAIGKTKGGCTFEIEFITNLESETETEEIERAEADAEILTALKKNEAYSYPFKEQISIPSKFSASEISESDLFSTPDDKTDDKVLDFTTRPDFMRDEKMSGAERGTVLHTFMQFANFERARQDVDAEIENVVNNGHLTCEEAKVIDRDKVNVFLNSELCRRVVNADSVFKEYKFIIGVDSSRFKGLSNANDTVVIQGVADLVFIEGKNAVIVDYKTDKVSSEEELIGKYSLQLSIYKCAIEKLLGLEVKQCLIYSLSLGKQIEVNLNDSPF